MAATSVWPARITRPATVSVGPPQAKAAYERGRAALAIRSIPSLQQAATSFRDAIRADPAFAEAYAGLASAYTLSGIFGGLARREAVRLSTSAATEALRLNPNLAEALTAMAFASHVWLKQWNDAEARYKRAIELNPDLAQAHHRYALLLDSLVRPQEALSEIRRAAALEPLSLSISSDVGMILAHQGRFEEGIAQFQKTIALDPSYADAYQEMGWACALAGRYEEAETAFVRAGSLSVPRGQMLAGLGYTYARSGRRDKALEALRGIESASTPEPGLRESLQAFVLLGLGDNDRALDLLLRAHPDSEPNLKVGRIYDPIRNDPRFQELLRRSGLL